MGVSVKILQKNRYGDARGKAKECKPGDILVTTANYAQILVEQGSACYPTEIEALNEPTQAEYTPPPFEDVKGVNGDVAGALEATGVTWAELAEMDEALLQRVPGVGPSLAKRIKKKAEEVVEAAK